MIRAMSLALLTALLVALAPGAAQDAKPSGDDDPPLLKKKKTDDKPAPPKVKDDKPKEEKPKADVKPEAKKDDKEKDKDDPVADLEAKAKEVMARIAKNLRSAEDRLKANDAGDGTQQVQRDIVKDLDSLLENLKQQEQQQAQQQQQQQQQEQQAGGGMGGGKNKSGSSSSRRTARKPGQGQQPGQGEGQQQAKGNGEKPGQGEQGKGQGEQGKGQGEQGKGGEKPGQGGNQAGMGGTSPAGVDKLADLYKDVWGHLPETLRQEMDAYQKEGYMAKYRELLKLYYATIAEKGRRTPEDGK